MKRKVLGAQEALESGVRRVVIADGRTEQPITGALGGAGTEFLS
jgi:acetylglutamate/LysW-gamma-L-alpha-aminoadipate kinase